jgi:hypothetical protein
MPYFAVRDRSSEPITLKRVVAVHDIQSPRIINFSSGASHVESANIPIKRIFPLSRTPSVG